jgi:UDP:flavonoid glycosyltransferase YjiC (YdhE family)
VRTVLAEPAYRTNAARVRDENAALPGLGRAVALLERLAREPQPIPTA